MVYFSVEMMMGNISTRMAWLPTPPGILLHTFHDEMHGLSISMVAIMILLILEMLFAGAL